MYTIRKTLLISGAHKLKLPYPSKCSELHGHNWRITVECSAPNEELGECGLLVDFELIKQTVMQLDHKNLNVYFGKDFNPTAENIAAWLYHQIPYCSKVEVEESPNNVVMYSEP